MNPAHLEGVRVLVILGLLEAAILGAQAHPFTKKFFRFPPAVFWIYFLPMILAAIGVLPRRHDVYIQVPEFLLPASLVLLLTAVDLKRILQVGPTAFGMMMIGSTSIVLGAPLVFLAFQKWLPEQGVSGFAALAASWTGGSANMIAVKEAIGVPDGVFLPMVLVDTIGAYTWMGLLIALAAFQEPIDRWNSAVRNHRDRSFHDSSGTGPWRDLSLVSGDLPLYENNRDRSSKPDLSLKLLMSFAIALLGVLVGRIMPDQTGRILAATTLGILFSFTPLRTLSEPAAERGGYILLYFILTCIGARADLQGILNAPVLIPAGFAWLLLHGVVMLAAARMLRVPLGIVAAASQANIGGPVSAPIVAAVYDARLAPVGLLLGIFGNMIGTYLGLACAYILSWVP